MNQTSTFETHTLTSQATISSCTIWTTTSSTRIRTKQYIQAHWVPTSHLVHRVEEILDKILYISHDGHICDMLARLFSINKDAFRLTLDGYKNDKYLQYSLKDDDTVSQTIVNWINLQFCPPSRQLQDINVNPTPDTTLQTPSTTSIPSLQQTSGQRDQHLSTPVFIRARSTRFTRCSPQVNNTFTLPLLTHDTKIRHSVIIAGAKLSPLGVAGAKPRTPN